MATSYNAGRAYIEVVPSLEGFQKKVAKDMATAGKVGGVSFREAFEAATGRPAVEVDADTAAAVAQGKAAAEEIDGTTASVRVGADTAGGEKSVLGFMSLVKQVDQSTADVRVDAETAPAVAQIATVQAMVDSLASKDATVELGADASSARAQIAAVGAAAEALDGKDVDIRVDADTASARAQLAAMARSTLGPVQGINAIAAAGLLLGPALVPGIAAASGALVGLTGAAVASAGAMGVVALAIAPVIEAVSALAKAEDAAVEDAEKAAKARAQHAKAVEAAQQSVEDAERGVTRAREQAARGAEEAARRVAEAQAGVVEAERAGAEQVADAARKVDRARQAAADRLDDAQAKVRAAAAAVAEAEADAARSVEAAQRAADDARADAAQSARDHARKVEDAQRDVADAVTDRAQAMVDAQKDIADAVQDAQDAFEDVQDAARDVGEAYRDATQDVRDLKRELGDGSLDARGAELDLADARKRLKEVREDPDSDWIDRERAALRVEEAERRLNKVRQDQVDLQHDLNQAHKDANALRKEAERYGTADGGDGPSSAALSQIERLRDAEEAHEEARAKIAGAQSARQKVWIEETRKVQDAQRALSDARAEQSRAAAEHAQKIADADARVTQAQQDGAEKVAAAQGRVAAAKRDLQRTIRENNQSIGDAERGLARASEDAAARVAAAKEKVGDALDAQAQQAADSGRAVEDAQRNLSRAQGRLQEAMAATAVAASTAQRDVEDAFADLTPAGAAFARQLFRARDGMDTLSRTAQNTMLPGVSRAFSKMGENFPGLNKAVGLMGESLGRLAEDAANALTGPWWQQFGTWISESAPRWFDKFGRAGGNTLTALAGMFQALSPVIDWFLVGLEDATKRWADWATELDKNNGAQKFIDYIMSAGPLAWEFLTKLGNAVIHLGKSLAPLGEQVLRVTGRFLDWFNSLDEEKLRRFYQAVALTTGGLFGVATAIRLAFTAMGALKVGVLAVKAVLSPFGAALGWLATKVFPNTTGKVKGLWAALKANPLGAIKAAFSRLGSFLARFNPWTAVAAVALAFFGTMYTEHEGFRQLVDNVFRQVKNIIKGVWNWLSTDGVALAMKGLRGIGNGFQWVYDKLIKPAIGLWKRAAYLFADWIVKVFNPWLQRSLDAMGKFFSAVYRDYIKPAWRKIQAAASAFWAWFRDTGWPGIKRIARAMGEYFSWLYENRIKPAWNKIQAAAKVFWDWFKNTGWPGIKRIARAMGEYFSWLYAERIKPAWEKIQGAAQKFWSWFRDTGWPGIKRIVTWLWEAFQTARDKIGAAWDRIEGAASSAKTFMDEKFSQIKSGIGKVADAFDTAQSAIKKAWDKIKDAAKAPAKFLVNTVYNDGIRGMVNGMTNAFGLGRPLKEKKLAFAGGGTIPGHSPTPTADNIPIWATAGEYMLPVKATKRLMGKVGSAGMEMLRRGIIPQQGYATGGLIRFGRELQRMGLQVYENAAFGGVTPGAHKTGKYGWHYKHGGTGAIDVDADGPGGQNNALLDKAVRMALQRGLGAIWQAPNHYDHAHFDVGGFQRVGTSRKEGGVASKWAGAKAALSYLSPQFRGVTSASDKAREALGKGWENVKDFGAAVKRKLSNFVSSAFSDWDFSGVFPDALKSGFTSTVRKVANHIAPIAAGFNAPGEGEEKEEWGTGGTFAHGGLIQGPYLRDTGGWIPTGTSLVQNNTGMPELVLTAKQAATVGAAGSAPQVNMTINNPAAERPSRTAQKATRYAALALG